MCLRANYESYLGIHKTVHHHIGQSNTLHGDATEACSIVTVTDAPVEYDSECRW